MWEAFINILRKNLGLDQAGYNATTVHGKIGRNNDSVSAPEVISDNTLFGKLNTIIQVQALSRIIYKSQTFLTGGTWVRPSGVTEIWFNGIAATSGGGGGGGSSSDATATAGTPGSPGGDLVLSGGCSFTLKGAPAGGYGGAATSSNTLGINGEGAPGGSNGASGAFPGVPGGGGSGFNSAQVAVNMRFAVSGNVTVSIPAGGSPGSGGAAGTSGNNGQPGQTGQPGRCTISWFELVA